VHPLHLRIRRFDHVILIGGVCSASVPETEMSGGKMQGISREDVSGPGTGATRQDDGIDPALAIHRSLGANKWRVGGCAIRIVAAGHVHLDIAESMLGQMRFECRECLAGLHVWHQPEVYLSYRPVRKDGLAADAGVTPNQSFDVNRRPRL